MLETGPYPLHLKKRIRDGQGHLSNKQALELFMKHKAPFMSYLFLAHISKNNNSPRIVENLFATHAGNTEIVIASRYRETKVYAVHATGRADQVKQLALF
jgi:phosphoribosyl 1,2-cyclic phosphodiesterase